MNEGVKIVVEKDGKVIAECDEKVLLDLFTDSFIAHMLPLTRQVTGRFMKKAVVSDEILSAVKDAGRSAFIASLNRATVVAKSRTF